MIGIPKQPADRNLRLRELAEGEDCTVLLPGGACDPSTVVWGHSNELADQKGKGYKGHDSAGFFACHRCHSIIDQPPASSGMTRERLLEIVRLAQARTDVRLIAIATSPTMRAWKVKAAKWALERRGVNCD